MLPKQDRNGVRTPQGIERKYGLGSMKENIVKQSGKIQQQDDEVKKQRENIKQIQKELNNKVDKEEGKGLSSNDFSDKYKEQLESAKRSSHLHFNKLTLDKITEDIWREILKATEINRYDLTQYATEDVTVNGKFEIKNSRAVLNAQIILVSVIEANKDITILRNLPTGNVSCIFQLKNGVCKLNNNSLVVNLFDNINTLIVNLIFDI